MLTIAFNGHAPAPKEYSLLNLRSNQSLSIRYESVGCFHHFTYRFEFSEDHVILSLHELATRLLKKDRI